MKGKSNLILLYIAVILIIAVSFPWSAFESNMCQLCASNLARKQVNDCGDPDTTNFRFCHLCSQNNVESSLAEPEAITIHGYQVEANPKFLYNPVQVLPSKLIMYNSALNLKYSIPFSGSLFIPETPSSLPYSLSKVDKSRVNFESFLRMWWAETITATVPLTVAPYQIEIFAQNSSPAPIFLRIHVAEHQLGLLQWDLGDGSWTSKCIYLPAQYVSNHPETVITVEYINDNVMAQGDRDAFIAWLRLVPYSQQ